LCHMIACPNCGALLSWYEAEEHLRGCRPPEQARPVPVRAVARKRRA